MWLLGGNGGVIRVAGFVLSMTDWDNNQSSCWNPPKFWSLLTSGKPKYMKMQIECLQMTETILEKTTEKGTKRHNFLVTSSLLLKVHWSSYLCRGLEVEDLRDKISDGNAARIREIYSFNILTMRCPAV